MADDPSKTPDSEPSEATAGTPEEQPQAALTPDPDPIAEPIAEANEPPPQPAGPASEPKGGNIIDQAELDSLRAQFEALQQEEAAARAASPTPARASAASVPPRPQASPPPPPAPDPAPAMDDDELMREMAAAIASESAAPAVAVAAHVPPAPPAAPPPPDPIPGIEPYQPDTFDGVDDTSGAATIELLDDVELDVRVELGRTDMYIEDVLKLGLGSVIELDKLAGDPVDIYVNKRLVARGEVLVLNDNFCVRINSIHSPIPELETA